MDWIQNSTLHPVISQNLYRVKDGRIEQLGMSWLKHGFSVAAGSLCNQCTDPAWNYLGVGCSDPYGANLNGQQGGLGPRSEVNALTGAFAWPKRGLPSSGVLDGRLRVLTTDINPSLNTGARYFVESMYVHPQDAAAGNGLNNASYREVFVSAVSGGWTVSTSVAAQTVRMHPAINAWKAVHPDVQLFEVDIPGDGRVIVGLRTTQTAGGYHTAIAIENLNSHQSVRSLGVRFGSDQIANPGFRDVDYQFEPYSGDDWMPQLAGNTIEWSTETFAENQNANAIRWNTLYSFWCDSELPPRKLTLGTFRPGAVSEMTIDLVEPILPEGVKLRQGVVFGGSPAQLLQSDDNYYSLSLATKSNQPKIDLLIAAVSPVVSPSDFAFRLESKKVGATDSTITQTIELYNYVTSDYEIVDVRPVQNVDVALEITPSGDLSRFVHSTTGDVLARVEWKHSAGPARFTWTIDVDEAGWLVAD